MTEKSYEDAVQVLRDHMSGRWDGREGDGRDEMVRVLTQALRYDRHEAESTIDAMIRSGRLRYHNLHDDSGSMANPASSDPGIVPAAPQATGSAMPGAPTAPGVDFGPGYWEIGEEGGGELSGRRGQVTPR